MSTATAPSEPKTEVAKDRNTTMALRGPRLPYHPAIEERFGVDKASWKALVEAIFPLATCTESVILALSYCRARKLDPFKRNVHIVPIWSKEQGAMVDTIWPGIGELRTTAFRTGEYAGRGATVFGPDITQKVGSVEMTFPEWAQVSVFRMVKGQRVEFAGPRVYWLETYATVKRNDDTPNEMWRDRARGQIDKCAEAAALRAGFPEEVGCEYIPEEIHSPHGKTIDEPKRPGLSDLTAKLNGSDKSIAKEAADAKLSAEELKDENYNEDGEYIGPVEKKTTVPEEGTVEEGKQDSPDDDAELRDSASQDEALDALQEKFGQAATLATVGSIEKEELESGRWNEAGAAKVKAMAELARGLVRKQRGAGSNKQQELVK